MVDSCRGVAREFSGSMCLSSPTPNINNELCMKVEPNQKRITFVIQDLIGKILDYNVIRLRPI